VSRYSFGFRNDISFDNGAHVRLSLVTITSTRVRD